MVPQLYWVIQEIGLDVEVLSSRLHLAFVFVPEVVHESAYWLGRSELSGYLLLLVTTQLETLTCRTSFRDPPPNLCKMLVL